MSIIEKRQDPKGPEAYLSATRVRGRESSLVLETMSKSVRRRDYIACASLWVAFNEQAARKPGLNINF